MTKIVLAVFALAAILSSAYFSGSLVSAKRGADHRSLAIQMVERSMR